MLGHEDSRATLVARLGANLAQLRRENQALRTDTIGLRAQLAQLLEQNIALANNWRHEMARRAEVEREASVVRVQQDDAPAI